LKGIAGRSMVPWGAERGEGAAQLGLPVTAKFWFENDEFARVVGKQNFAQ